ncbi:hypothetical protein N657DRAFT_630188 [Parathielavia appendiculata]|uniref:Uncharacterized protein n=1 Tax=Parathielavia appendiculata TaxID=2587402 RepID=A0AAN6UA36_9PEZI|nr:hypothetical protein N657DRAFT_630188 [Parathielavia appendiculata]
MECLWTDRPDTPVVEETAVRDQTEISASGSWKWVEITGRPAPCVDLAGPRGGPAASSILLDYQCTPTPWRWLRALRLGQTTVGLTTLTGLALQYVVPPFAARLFTTEAGLSPADISVSFESAYNRTSVGLDDIDWRPALTNARVAIIQGENPVPSYMAANTTACSAHVSCEVISDYTMSLDRQEPESGATQGVVRVTATDRVASSLTSFLVAGMGSDIFFDAGQKLGCSRAAHHSRLVFTAGQYAPTSPYLLSNISVISCATDDQAVNGTLEVAVKSSSTVPAIRSLKRPPGNDTSNSVRRHTLWQLIERGMPNPVIAGNESLLAPPALLQAISPVFTTTCAIGTATGTFDRLEAEKTAAGTLWMPATRLLVVEWAAYLIASLLLIVLILSGWVSWHAYHTRSILTEEPEGLLAMAGLLDGSELMALVPYTRQQPSYDGRVRKTGEQITEVKENAWVAEPHDDGALSGGWRVMRKIE